MSWSLEQRNRLAAEKQQLQNYFPTFVWQNPMLAGQTRLVGSLKTNSKNVYHIEVRLVHPDQPHIKYPDCGPTVLISSPMPLRSRTNEALTSSSATMHTLPAIDGKTRICLYKVWAPTYTIYRALVKTRVWLEAYDAHIRTGQPIDRFLHHIQ